MKCVIPSAATRQFLRLNGTALPRSTRCSNVGKFVVLFPLSSTMFQSVRLGWGHNSSENPLDQAQVVCGEVKVTAKPSCSRRRT